MLADVLAVPQADVFAPELVAVATRGMERWLSQQLADHLGAVHGGDGVCANVEFPFPATLVARAVGLPDPAADPWQPSRLVWPLLEVVDRHLDEPWLRGLRIHLGREDPPEVDAQITALKATRRFAAVRHLADLLDRYALHRPHLLLDWQAGRDVDPEGRPLPDGHRWQAEAFRRVRTLLEIPSPAERLRDAVTALRDPTTPRPDLPERICGFGLTSLPPAHLAVLTALGARDDTAVHLFLLHPSPALWDRVAAEPPPPPAGPLPVLPPRDQDPSTAVVRHPLLASWGRDSRELQTTLAALHPSTPVTGQPPPDAAPATLLARIQADLRADREPTAAGPHPLAADDTSLQVHACHGRTRQVEVLHDALLHLLEADPTLEPRDIVVMCPDVEAFAPLVTAVFRDAREEAPLDARGLPNLRVRLADRALTETNPLLGVVADLLAMAGERVTASALLDLATTPPVRRRFQLGEEDLEKLQRWVRDAGIRWGLDAEQRAVFTLAGIAEGTVAAGVDRMLLGVAAPDDGDHLLGGSAPLDEVEGTDVDLAGRFAELTARLRTVLTRLQGPHPLDEWVAALVDAADALTLHTRTGAWERTQLTTLLDEVLAEAGPRRDAPLTRAELRALLDHRLRAQPTRANHRTGDLTVCTLVPMRAVPHRVVCLLGMDDEVFPRQSTPSGDDLVAADPRIGDHDPRTEDRQLLLDAVLAAEEHLVVTYAAHDERTGEPRHPCVPIAELLDVARATLGGDEVPPHVHRTHPLRATDARNFTGEAGWRSFDRLALAGARAAAAPSRTPTPFLTAPLPRPDDAAGQIELTALIRLLRDPAGQFLAQALGLWLPDDPELPDDGLPVELDGLRQWAVGDELLRARIDGVDEDRVVAVLRGRGELPPGRLADPTLAQIRAAVDHVATLADEVGAAVPARDRTHADIDVRVPDGRRLVGRVPEVATPDRLVAATYSKVQAKRLVDLWVQLLALTAAHPDTAWRAVLVGRATARDAVAGCAVLGPLGDDADARHKAALTHLADLVALFDRGRRQPLPLPLETAEAYARARADGHDPDAAAAAAADRWQRARHGEADRQAHQLVHGGVVPFEAVLAVPTPDDEPAGTEPTWFGSLARRVWDPLLSHCAEDTRRARP